MGRLHKIILLIVSFLGLLCSAAMLSLFYYIPVLTDSVRFAYNIFPLLHDILAVYVLLVAVGFLLLIVAAIFSPKASRYLVITKDGAQLQFSKQTVETTVRHSFSDVEGISLASVKAVLGHTPEKTRIFVKLSLTDPNRLVELTGAVKNKIEASLKSSLGVSVKSINIKVIELAHGIKPHRHEAAVIQAVEPVVVEEIKPAAVEVIEPIAAEKTEPPVAQETKTEVAAEPEPEKETTANQAE